MDFTKIKAKNPHLNIQIEMLSGKKNPFANRFTLKTFRYPDGFTSLHFLEWIYLRRMLPDISPRTESMYVGYLFFIFSLLEWLALLQQFQLFLLLLVLFFARITYIIARRIIIPNTIEERWIRSSSFLYLLYSISIYPNSSEYHQNLMSYSIWLFHLL